MNRLAGTQKLSGPFAAPRGHFWHDIICPHKERERGGGALVQMALLVYEHNAPKKTWHLTAHNFG